MPVCELESSFWSRISVGDESECWPVKGAYIYGVVWHKGRRWRAHRLAYTLTKGPIPNGLYVCHTCDNPPCCNPNHLWVGTAGQNNTDRHRKGRSVKKARPGPAETQVRGERQHLAKLKEWQVRIILTNSRSCGQLARDFNVNASTVERVRRRETWRHVV